MVVACRQHSLSYSERDIFEVRPVQLLHSSVVGIAINVYNGLGEVSAEFELDYVFVCFSKIVGGVCLEELRFASEDSTYLLGELAIFEFFIVEELAAFGSVIDDC